MQIRYHANQADRPSNLSRLYVHREPSLRLDGQVKKRGDRLVASFLVLPGGSQNGLAINYSKALEIRFPNLE